MAEPLRPMSTGELLDRTFAIYKQHFALFLGIALPAPTLYLLLQLIRIEWFLRHSGLHGGNVFMRPQVLWFWVSVLLVWLLGIAFVNPPTIRAVSAVHLGREISVTESYRALRGRVLTVTGIVARWMGPVILGTVAGFVGIVIVGTIIELSSVSLGLSSFISSLMVGFLALVTMVVAVLLVWVRYALAIQVCVVEDLGAAASVRRSKSLTQGSVVKIAVIYLMVLVIGMVVSFTLTYAARYVSLPMHSARLLGILNAVGGFVSGALTSPLATIAMSLVYYDERVRKEGFDLQLMMVVLDEPHADAAFLVT